MDISLFPCITLKKAQLAILKIFSPFVKALAIAAALCYDKIKLWLYHRNG